MLLFDHVAQVNNISPYLLKFSENFKTSLFELAMVGYKYVWMVKMVVKIWHRADFESLITSKWSCVISIFQKFLLRSVFMKIGNKCKAKRLWNNFNSHYFCKNQLLCVYLTTFSIGIVIVPHTFLKLIQAYCEIHTTSQTEVNNKYNTQMLIVIPLNKKQESTLL